MTVESQKPVGWKNNKCLHSPLKVFISELNKCYVKIYKVTPRKCFHIHYQLSFTFFFQTGFLYIALVALELTLCVKQAGLQLTEIHHALPAECCYLSYVPPHKTKLSFIFDYYVINYCHVPPQQTKISIMFYHYVANYLLDSEDQICTQKLTVDSHY